MRDPVAGTTVRASSFGAWARIAAARVLQLVLGLIVLYATLPMFSSAGLQQPNVLVWAGLICIGLLTASASRGEGHLLAGVWVSVLAFALPVILLSLPPLGDPPCPPDHPPLTQLYYCVFLGYAGLLAVALVLLALALVGAAFDLRALLGGAGRAP